MVLFSEGASDTYHGLVGPMTAEWLKIPFIGYVRKLEVGTGSVKCESSLEEHEEVVEATLPAAASVVSEINSPRYPTLLQIMQASKKPIDEVTLDSLRDAEIPKPRVSVLEVRAQSVNRKRKLFEGSAEEASRSLVEVLRRDGVI